ncbi:MAG: hypothetical protein ACJATG_002447, partial [Dinoroseobacter sp.]
DDPDALEDRVGSAHDISQPHKLRLSNAWRCM